MTSLTALVDLDGTLTDPADGILGGFEFALRRLDAPVPPRSDLGWVIGPPLRKAFPKLLPVPTPEAVETAVLAYREYYGVTGIFEATVYDGIHDSLAALRQTGFSLLLCTAKPRVFAIEVLRHFDLARHFDGIYGAELDGRFDDKGELIAHILSERGFAPHAAVMIGDRGSDMSAAARNAICGIGVSWGYGSHGELADAGARLICSAPSELRTAVPQVIGLDLA